MRGNPRVRIDRTLMIGINRLGKESGLTPKAIIEMAVRRALQDRDFSEGLKSLNRSVKEVKDRKPE